jgi:hypothetical protein
VIHKKIGVKLKGFLKMLMPLIIFSDSFVMGFDALEILLTNFCGGSNTANVLAITAGPTGTPWPFKANRLSVVVI